MSDSTVNKTSWTKEEMDALPKWAREIVRSTDGVRRTALYYRHEAVALRKALHDLCVDDPRGLAFYDAVCESAKSVFARLEESGSEEDLKERNAVRAKVKEEVDRMVKAGKLKTAVSARTGNVYVVG